MDPYGLRVDPGGMQSLQRKVPQHFELMGQRKGFVRYMSPDLRALVKQHADALERKETALTAILQVSFCILYTSCTSACSLEHLLATAQGDTCGLPSLLQCGLLGKQQCLYPA